jgi:LacI family transcriptional regulator
MQRSSRATLQDVAREAGVSAMTVSVVLNGARSATRVSDATRARILAAAERLRYTPNAAARGLQKRRMDTLGVVAVIDGGELNLYFLEVLNGILEAAVKHGQNTTVFPVPHWEAGEERILEFADGRVDGLLFIGALFSPKFAETLYDRIPYVTIHGEGVPAEMYNLTVNDEGGAYTITRHLIEQGHRRILHLTGSLELSGAQDRLIGYRRALEEADISFDESLVLHGGFWTGSGWDRMKRFLREHDGEPLPTAAFCASDAIASGCMEALNAHGLRVPDDISIVGFDDTLNARMTAPPLTTMRQPFRKIGHRAVEMLLSQIAPVGKDAEIGTEVIALKSESLHRSEVFEVELILRGSVGAPPANPVIISMP